MNDDFTPLQDRITKIVGNEDRLNRERLTGMKVKKDRRDAEKRTETANLATLDTEKEHQLGVNAGKERKYVEEIKREGEVLVDLSKKLRDEYIMEKRHREETTTKMQAEATVLEQQLRSIETSRP